MTRIKLIVHTDSMAWNIFSNGQSQVGDLRQYGSLRLRGKLTMYA